MEILRVSPEEMAGQLMLFTVVTNGEGDTEIWYYTDDPFKEAVDFGAPTNPLTHARRSARF
jgi:hypothetical protein